MPHRSSYGTVAALYDTYVQADFDVQFFCDRVKCCAGSVLELMAGTGRLSRKLFDCNPRLTCVDISREMLGVLAGKLTERESTPALVCADVRSLPLRRGYELAIIPFNSFAELISAEDQLCSLAELNRVVVTGGHVICTLHNPAVRRLSLDGEERLLGRYPLTQGRELELLVTGTVERDTGLAHSRQRFRIWDVVGELVEEHLQELRFALITDADLAAHTGFEIVELLGDYNGAAYARETSPFMIWTIEKVRAIHPQFAAEALSRDSRSSYPSA